MTWQFLLCVVCQQQDFGQCDSTWLDAVQSSASLRRVRYCCSCITSIEFIYDSQPLATAVAGQATGKR
eukprot:6206856-Pleurochrysis_carterae.AAC.1